MRIPKNKIKWDKVNWNDLISWVKILILTWNSDQYYVASLKGGEFGGEWIHVLIYVWLSPFAVHIKLSQHCYLAMRMKVLAAWSCLTLCDPMDLALQAPLSMAFSKQEYWSGLLFLPPADLPNPGTEPRSPALQADSLPSELPGKPNINKKFRKLISQFIGLSCGKQNELGLDDSHSGEGGWLLASTGWRPEVLINSPIAQSRATRKPLAPNVNVPRLGILDRLVSFKAISHSDRNAYREALCKPGFVFRNQGGLDDKTQNPMQISWGTTGTPVTLATKIYIRNFWELDHKAGWALKTWCF